jgi:light-regulated signal transduction histidine kinase (bacteriophytochrome)
MIGASRDITKLRESEFELKALNEKLEKRAKELAASNEELEQFAYVASHDLQEPLRMVTNFLSQIEKKYSDLLDEKGKTYIHFAVDGAKRMRQMILDLLEFSRAGRIDTKYQEVNLDLLVKDILDLHQKKIEETDARVIIGELPVITAPKTALRQVFQNLINNSLKYSHSKNGAIPQISISAKDKNDHWQFEVKDNVIGIEPQYFEKIFVIFQRLHDRSEYTGTGIGLAISKKIIENMGGKIWVESEPGNGSSFFFTVPKKSASFY